MSKTHLRFFGIFLLSFATLLLELSLTRVLSVALWYHFGFLVISTALLGFGASGTILSMWHKLRTQMPLDIAMANICTGFAISAIVSFALMQKIPFEPFSLLSDPWQFLFMPLYFIVVALPFFWSGLGIALLLTRGAEDVNRYYAWDLVGAALGCLAVILVLPIAGGEGSIFVAGACGALAGVAFTIKENVRGLILNSILAALLAISVIWADSIVPINITENKSGSSRTLEPD